MESLIIPTHTGIEMIKYADIIRLEASGSYCVVHTCNNKVPASKNLSHFQGILCPSMFFRSHRSHMVNLEYLTRYNKITRMLELANGESVPLSKENLPKFKQILIKWQDSTEK